MERENIDLGFFLCEMEKDETRTIKLCEMERENITQIFFFSQIKRGKKPKNLIDSAKRTRENSLDLTAYF